jgi:hypothetical protein
MLLVNAHSIFASHNSGFRQGIAVVFVYAWYEAIYHFNYEKADRCLVTFRCTKESAVVCFKI